MPKKKAQRRTRTRAPSTRLVALKNQARRAGWLRYLRKGAGQEADERAILAGCRFDLRRAQHFLEFCERYGSLTEGGYAGQPFDLLDWQREDTARIFGWIRDSPEWGYPVRRFRYVYLEAPKKSGKTPLASIIGNYLFFADSWRRQINQHTVATTRKQAERLLTHAIRQIRAAPDLARVARIRKLEGFSSVSYGHNLWTVLAADPESADGINGHVIADELHRWQGFEFYNTLRWAIAAQPEGLFVGITTAPADSESVCNSLRQKTKEIDAGRQHDQTFYGRIYAADPTDDPHDERTWRKANPSLGTTRKHPLKMSDFRADYESAKADPTQWPTWCQLRLGIPRSGSDSWIDSLGGLHVWDAGPAARASRKRRIDNYENFRLEDLTGSRCYVALDGATHHDTTAAVFTFPSDTEPEVVRVLPYFWLPRAEAEQQQTRAAYHQWSEAGHITLTDGDAVDFAIIERDLLELLELLQPEKLFFDRLFQAEWLTQRLAEASGIERVAFPQRITTFAPCMALASRLIVLRKLRHNGHPVLTWQLSHCQAKTDVNNNQRPVKRQKSDWRTVDGVVAMVMSLADCTAEPESDYYDDHDVELI